MTGEIDLSKRYKTRGGADVRLYCTDARGAFPVIGHIINPIREADTLATWTSTGMVSPSGRWSSGDLVEVAPYADIAIDDVVVTPSGAKAHFAGLAPDGRPRVWADGRTSHTAKASTCADVGWTTVKQVIKLSDWNKS